MGEHAPRKEAAGTETPAPWHPAPLPAVLLVTARELRRRMTAPEHALWQCLRRRQLDGFRFRKQHPIGQYVLDFYCPAARLAIELDGSHHASAEERVRDAERSAVLAEHGIRVLRFWNHDVYANLKAVLILQSHLVLVDRVKRAIWGGPRSEAVVISDVAMRLGR